METGPHDAAIPSLSPAQRKMLGASARNFGRVRRNGEDANFTWVGRGQASTAKKLEELGLGAYVSDGYSAKFWVWEPGVEVARALGLIS